MKLRLAAVAALLVGALPVAAAGAQVPPAPQFLLEFGGAGSGTGALGASHQTEQVAVDADGNVWVADKSNNRVVKFDYNGEYLTEVRSAGPGRGSFDDPQGIAADAEGFVYVADTLNDRIVKLTTGGAPEAVFETVLPGPNPAAEPRTPTALAVDSRGRLLVQAAAGVIRLASADGKRLGVFTTETGSGVAVDAAGNVYTTQLSTESRVLAKFRPDGTKVGEFSAPTSELIEGLFGQGSTGVAVHPSGIVHVSDFRGGVQRYSPDGTYLDRYPADDTPLPDGSILNLYIATSVAIDCRGNSYVVNGEWANPNKVTVAKFGDPAAEPPPCAPRPLPKGEIFAQVNDVEVTQGIQSARTSSPNRSINGAQRPPSYADLTEGGETVPLAEKRDTVVRVYASLRAGPAGGVANVPATLEVTQRVGGRTIRHDPILPIAQPAVLRNRGADSTVRPADRANPAGAYSFVLPPEWARGVLSLEARVNPAGIGCPSAECRHRSSFRLNDVPFQRTAVVGVFPLALTIGGKLPVYMGERLDAPGPAFDLAKRLTPLSLSVFPWLGRIEVGDITPANITIVETSCFLGIELDILCQEEDKVADREARQTLILERIARWVDDNNVRDNTMTAGVMSFANPILPGAMGGRVFDEDQQATGYLTDKDQYVVAHEVQHALGRPHASMGCGATGKQAGEPWAPDEQGFLRGIGIDVRRGSGGGRGPFAILSPGANGGPAQWYDVMSYCAGPKDAWISPRGWRNVINFPAPGGTAARAAFGPSAGPLATPSSSPDARASQAGRVLRVVAVARGDGSLNISGVSPGEGPAETGDPASGFLLETRDAAGKRVIASSPMRAEPLPDSTATALVGEVPSAGAGMVVVRSQAGAITRVVRSAKAPSVRLLSPRGGGRVRRAIDVRWRAVDADPGPLSATVEYSADGGRTWTTKHIGTSRGRVSLNVAELAPSRRARVRLRVDDGFAEAVAVSRSFTVPPAPPQVRIVDPAGGLRVRPDAPLVLRGEAFAGGRKLSGGALRWFDGRRALGSGETLTLDRINPGAHTLRLVASAGGRSSSRRVRVRVRAVRAQFLVLSPGRLGRRARTARLRVRTNVPATLIVGRARVVVGPRTRRVTVPVRPGSRPARLALTLRTAAGSIRTTLTVARR